MIERYWFVKLRDAHVADRDAIAAHLRDTLAGRAGVVAVSAGTPADDSARSWDLGVVVRSPDLAALAALLAEPAVSTLLDDWLAARAVVVKAWSFQLVGTPDQ